MIEDVEDILQPRTFEDNLITFIGDNVDHNIVFLYGKGTFHIMGELQ